MQNADVVRNGNSSTLSCVEPRQHYPQPLIDFVDSGSRTIPPVIVNATPALHRRCCVSFFPKWLYTFGRDVIALSDQYPLISGFYKLLAVAIRLGDALGYFAREPTSPERDSDGDELMSEVSCPTFALVRWRTICRMRPTSECVPVNSFVARAPLGLVCWAW